VREPIIWTGEQLEADRLEAIARFRAERLEEPLEDYLEAFDAYKACVEELLEASLSQV
jgi:exonuclease VII small subunit